MSHEQHMYERFKLIWMLDHGYTLYDLIDELQKYREECDDDMSLKTMFDDWEYGYGFGSEIWPCYEEFLACEYNNMTE